jgi:curli biogenesis system outer membrane secretion channel CsgG
MKNQFNALLLTAALAGLAGGTTVAAQSAAQGSAQANSAKVIKAGLRYSGTNAADTKHSCKGKNDCKGQGGGKNPGKNDCKGKGGCATDGSKPPKKA